MEEKDLPNIKTGNGIDRDLAATTNDRLTRTVVKLDTLNEIVEQLKNSTVSFADASDKSSKKLVRLTWVLVVLTITLIGMTYFLMVAAKEQTSSQNNIALNALFFTPENMNIVNAIENSQPILTENHGQNTDIELENYLNEFDTIESSYDEGYLSQSDLCDSFSYYINATSKNTEVQNYILGQQKIDSGFFMSLSDLENIVTTSKNINCH